jgi:hypothetical protein
LRAPSPAVPPLVRLVLGLFVAWAGIALGNETGAALESWDFRELNTAPGSAREHYPAPCEWRLGMAPVDRLRRCLAGVAADGRVPRDSVVVFTSPAGPCRADFFRARWAAYLLLELQVVAPGDPLASPLASFLISYRVEPVPPPGGSLELLRQLEGGRLYRIRRP